MYTFFTTIQKSCYSPSFYASIKHRSLGSSLGYFVSLIFLLAVIVGIMVAIFVLPGFTTGMQKFVREVGEVYPEGLTITFKDGVASTNQPGPVLIPMPDPLLKLLEADTGQYNFHTKEDLPLYLVAIDTRESVNTAELNYDALIFVNKEYVTYPKDNDSLTVDKINPELNLVITKAKVSSALADVEAWTKFTPLVFILGVLLLALVYALFHLVYLLFAALLIYLVLVTKKLSPSYVHAYKIGLYAVTGPLLLKLIFFAFIPPVPFLFTLLVLLFAWVNLSHSPKLSDPDRLK